MKTILIPFRWLLIGRPFVVGVSLGLAFASEPGFAANNIPKIYWDYGFSTDENCLSSAVAYKEKLPDSGILSKSLVERWAAESPAWTHEAIMSSAALKKAWDGIGVALLRQAIAIVSLPFARRELTSSLFVCLNQNSVGNPLSVNIAYYLRGPAGALAGDVTWANRLKERGLSLPLSADSFAEMSFHEVLHIYVMQVLRVRKSDLIRCHYRNEAANVKAHLHVFALEKLAFQRLAAKSPANASKLLEVLRTSQEFFHVTGAKDYVRAWEIINSPDEVGPDPFIRELRAPPSSGGVCPWCTPTDFLSIDWVLRLSDPNTAGCR